MNRRTVLVLGASGCVGAALVPELVSRGVSVRAASRHPESQSAEERVEWVLCDVRQPQTLGRALEGVDAAYYLVHSIGQGPDYDRAELESARNFARVAAGRGVQRIIYLGGVAPAGEASRHLRSRLAVGAALREGSVPCLELRASMVIAGCSASWQIVRDLTLRLPAMVLPGWLRSRMCPVALEDVVTALADGLDVPLERSAWFDLPGPEMLSGREILERVAALQGRRIPVLEVPVLTPTLSAYWVRFISRAQYAVAKELILGMTGDLLPRDGRYWELTGHSTLVPFDVAVARALEQEPKLTGFRGALARAEELMVRIMGRGVSRRREART